RRHFKNCQRTLLERRNVFSPIHAKSGNRISNHMAIFRKYQQQQSTNHSIYLFNTLNISATSPINDRSLWSSLILIGCNKKNAETENQVSQTEVQDETVYVSKAQFENAKMSLGKISEQEFAQTVHTSGEIDVPPQNIAVISSFAGGYVKNTLLIIGDKVKKGDPLLRIENPEFINMQQQYLENTEQLSY